MAITTNEAVKLAVDAHKGCVTKYSVGDANKALREYAVELNHGKTALNYKDIRAGKCWDLFALIEEILANTIVDGLQGDEYFNTLVEFRNLAAGDKNEFWVEDRDMYVVADIADGIQGVRRQRLGGATKTSIDTTVKMVRIYEEMNRILSGAVDFNAMIDNVGRSFRQKLLNDVYDLWTGVTAADIGGTKYFPVAGDFSDDALQGVIDHVEAAAGGMQATLLCTKAAARKLFPNITTFGGVSEAQSDLYTMGYVGQYFGTPVVVTPQRHKANTTDFVYSDKMISVIAGDQKPLKCVYEGDSTIIMGQPTDNADLTQDYMYAEKYGMGVVVSANTGIGRYQFN